MAKNKTLTMFDIPDQRMYSVLNSNVHKNRISGEENLPQTYRGDFFKLNYSIINKNLNVGGNIMFQMLQSSTTSRRQMGHKNVRSLSFRCVLIISNRSSISYLVWLQSTDGQCDRRKYLQTDKHTGRWAEAREQVFRYLKPGKKNHKV